MSFKGRNDPTNPLFKKLEIMKLKDILPYYKYSILQFTTKQMKTCLKTSKTSF